MMTKALPLLWIAFLTANLFAQENNLASTNNEATITFPLNRVFVNPGAGGGTVYARFNMALSTGDEIQTKKLSRCEITMPGGNVVRIDQNSRLEYVSDQNATYLALEKGQAWINIPTGNMENLHFIFSGHSYQVQGNGALFRLSVSDGDSLSMVLYRGKISLQKDGQDSPILTAGESMMTTVAEKPMMASVDTTSIADSMIVAIAEDTSLVDSSLVKSASMSDTIEEIAPQLYVISVDGQYTNRSLDPATDEAGEWVAWNLRRDAYLTP